MPLVAVTCLPPSVIFDTLLAYLTLGTSRTALGSCYQNNPTKTQSGKRMEGNFTIDNCNPVGEAEDKRNNKIVLPVLLDASNASSIQSSEETNCLSRMDSIANPFKETGLPL